MKQNNKIWFVSYVRNSAQEPKIRCCQKVQESQVSSLKSALEADSQISNIKVTEG